ncbi:ribbon-helix-helix domain-containing protein [Azospirillum soli]|uniref:ribbon-helix-helix domain-containing protein n=1 Tax=Azospirillum soli TaxID=1304799 RepID=UPI001AE154F8|nr:ribbon-helix-helix domain-containing protein [Azospirillum soli]MBP2310751.1 putative DNA-binding ribbon-helix-helix protein [Azospirillum soli]
MRRAHGERRAVPALPGCALLRAQHAAGWASHRPVCRNLTVSGRRTSMALEPGYWDGLRDICAREGMTLNELCTAIDQRRGSARLTASVRVFVVTYFRCATPPPERELSPVLRAAIQDVG